MIKEEVEFRRKMCDILLDCSSKLCALEVDVENLHNSSSDSGLKKRLSKRQKQIHIRIKVLHKEFDSLNDESMIHVVDQSR